MLRAGNFVSSLLLLLILSVGLKAQSDDIQFERLSIEEGLSQAYALCILMDSHGFLWVGTQDGLNRYDGYNFKIFRNNPEDPSSISSNFIRTIYEDRSGILWVGTRSGGMNRFDPKTQKFTAYRNDPKSPRSIGGNTIGSIYEDRSGTLWIGSDGGLNKFDPASQSFTVYRHDPKNPNSLITN